MEAQSPRSPAAHVRKLWLAERRDAPGMAVSVKHDEPPGSKSAAFLNHRELRSGDRAQKIFHVQLSLAEREGFEPPVPEGHNRFRGALGKPIPKLSSD